MQLKDIMRKNVVSVAPETTIAEAAKRMDAANIGCLVVTNAGALKGIITDRDLSVRCTAEGHDPRKCQVSHHMSGFVYTADQSTDLLEATRIMTERQVKRLPIVENNQLIGLVSFSDIAQAMDEPMHDLLIGMGAARRIA